VAADRRAAFPPPGANEALVRPAADHGPAAGAAGQLAAQEMPGADGSEGRGLVGSQFVLGVAFPDLNPQRLWHYPQVRHLRADDVRRIAGTSATCACLPVLYPCLAAEHPDAAIEFIVDDAIAAFSIAVDGGRVPSTASGTRQAPGIEKVGDRSRRGASAVAAIYLEDDRGLRRLDRSQSSNSLA